MKPTKILCKNKYQAKKLFNIFSEAVFSNFTLTGSIVLKNNTVFIDLKEDKK